jgi:hypothetical protein
MLTSYIASKMIQMKYTGNMVSAEGKKAVVRNNSGKLPAFYWINSAVNEHCQQRRTSVPAASLHRIVPRRKFPD